MSTLKNMVKETKENRYMYVANENGKKVCNFMNGVSYEINPLDTLKIISASSIFGEPQYYRNGEFACKVVDGYCMVDKTFEDYSIFNEEMNGDTTSQIMERAIDNALDYDFKATLEWAKTLRQDFYMRLNPQVIMVRAAIHPKRVEFTTQYPNLFREINKEVMARGDEPSSQLAYYLYKNGKKNNVPNLLKRSWKSKLENLTPYQLNKYKNSAVGIIDIVRVCHANNKHIDELMTNGTIALDDNNKTWETLRASGMPWADILKQINMGHMALLRNLRGIFEEIDNLDILAETMQTLKDGVATGKQFPFRYFTAWKVIANSDVKNKQVILDTLEECIDLSCANLPTLKGKTMCLSDNSGSAWGTIPSEYGSVTVAEIDNLSSIITCANSEVGTLGLFGDRLQEIPISKRQGLLKQTKEASKKVNVGGSTENGIWLFFDKAIREKEHWDNIFIYSDQQAGHGGLYGIDESKYIDYRTKGLYIDVAKLIDTYRREVNPKVNVFSIQTAGYDNVLIPENGYRTSILYGWTGKELLYAKEIIDFWNNKEKQ